MEIKNKRLSDDVFYGIRKEILNHWHTGKDVADLQAGIDYQKSIPTERRFGDKLLKAKADPQRYSNLAVRVSGFSQKCNLLSPELQDHIINRTKHACL